MNADDRPQNFEDLIARITPELHQQLRTAVELGKWENGERLSAEQRGQCMELIIAWEHRHLPETERVAWIDKSRMRKKQQDGGA